MCLVLLNKEVLDSWLVSVAPRRTHAGRYQGSPPALAFRTLSEPVLSSLLLVAEGVGFADEFGGPLTERAWHRLREALVCPECSAASSTFP